MEDVSFKGTKVGDRKVESRLSRTEDSLLEEVHRAHFRYFQNYIQKDSGLVFDRSTSTSPISIAATGFGLSAYVVALYRSWITEEEAYEVFSNTLTTLERIKDEASFKGWWAHFLDPESLRPARSPKFWDSEFSTIDTTLLMWGVISVYSVLEQTTPERDRLRGICESLILAIDWREMLLNGLFGHGTDARGIIIPHVYRGYSEALLLYVLALGVSSEGQLEEGLWEKYLEEFSLYGTTDNAFVMMPGTPLFCYQYPHCWLDFRGVRDHVGRAVSFDYFENSRRLVSAQIQYAVDNPKKCRGYSGLRWGFSASDGPGWMNQIDHEGIERSFLGYNERGAPNGLDDGTICPAAQLAALPFMPKVVWEGVKSHINDSIKIYGREGFTGGYNLTFRDESGSPWVDAEMVGIDHGAAILMVENYRSGLLWSLCMKYQGTVRGMGRAGFR
jgi:hypothetical protein